MLRILAALCLAIALMSAAAAAVDKPLDDPALEARARAIHKKLRCLVCQNQSIEDSNADLAHDLRQLVRERLAQGDSDEEVIAFIVARYGDWVLLDPPVKPATWLLWAGPLLLVGGAGAVLVLRRRRRAVAPALSDDERQRVAQLLDKELGD